MTIRSGSPGGSASARQRIRAVVTFRLAHTERMPATAAETSLRVGGWVTTRATASSSRSTSCACDGDAAGSDTPAAYSNMAVGHCWCAPFGIPRTGPSSPTPAGSRLCETLSGEGFTVISEVG